MGRVTRASMSLFFALVLLAGALPASVAAVAPTTAPGLVSPASGANVGNANPTLQWKALSTAQRYRVQIATSSDFASPIYDQVTYAFHATPPNQLPYGTLYWRVAGQDSNGNTGPYSGARSFVKSRMAAPTPKTPPQATEHVLSFPDEPLVFSWEPVNGATSYTLEIDDAEDFVNATSKSTVNTSYTLTDTQAFTNSGGGLQSWYWHVRANFSTTQVTEWSPTWSYQIRWPGTVTLRTPTNGATDVKEVNFSWDPVPGAAFYQIQVSPNGDFQNNSVINKQVMSTRFSPYPTLLSDTNYWRVRARAAGGAQNYGPWTDAFVFTRVPLSRPVIVSPRYTAEPAPFVSALRLSWTPATASGPAWTYQASSYEIQFSTDINFSTYTSCITNHTTFTYYSATVGGGEPGSCSFPLDLVPGQQYYWRVRGIDFPKGVPGLWDNATPGGWQRFIYRPDMPTPTAPVDGALVSTPTLKWTGVSGVEQYQVTILKSDMVTTVVNKVKTYALSYTPTVALNPVDGPFYWHVETIDALGHVGYRASAADWPSFQIVAPTPDTSMAVLSPAAGARSIRMPAMTWKPNTSAAYYRVFLGNRSDSWYVDPLSGTPKLLFAGYTYDGQGVFGLLTQGHWWWQAVAYDALDHPIGSTTPRDFYVGSRNAVGWIIPWTDYTSPECNTRSSARQCVPLVGDTQELRWVADEEAGGYIVTVAKDITFTNPVREYYTTQTSLTPRESWLDSQAGESYYWFVTPCLRKTEPSGCGPEPVTTAGADNASAYRKYSAAQTGLYASTPANPPVVATTVPNQITFNWSDYLWTSKNTTYPIANVTSSRVTQEAKEYLFQAATSADFANLIETSPVRLDTTQYTPWDKTYPEGPVYWRVQAVDGSGNPLTMSETKLVTKKSPLPVELSPANRAVVTTGVPYFTWEPQNWAAKYQIEVYNGSDLTFKDTNRILQQQTPIAAWSPTTALAAGAYSWRVRRFDAGNLPGPWSAGRSFTLTAAAPNPTSPENGTSIYTNDVYLTWSGVQGAVKYRVDLSQSPTFTSGITSQITFMTAWSPVAQLAKGTWYWRVNVLDANNQVLSTSSPARNFVIDQDATWYIPVTPTRLLDTRTNTGTTGGALKGLSSRTFGVAGVKSIPTSALAVTGILTVTKPTASGWVSIGASSGASPAAVNFTAGDEIANNVTIKLSSSGQLSVYYGGVTTAASVAVIFDVTGYYSRNMTGASFVPVSPTRLLDSRNGLGMPGNAAAKFVRNKPRTFKVTGRSEIAIPANATAVSGNLTVTGQTKAGWGLLADKVVLPAPASTINFPLNDVRANGAFVPLASDGTLSLVYGGASDSATTDFVFDITGYYVPGDAGYRFYPLAGATQVLNTSAGLGLSNTFQNLATRTFGLTKTKGGAASGVPTTAVAISGNVTAVRPTSLGWVLISDYIQTPVQPLNVKASTLNFPAGSIRSNGLVVKTAPNASLVGVYYGPKCPTSGACGTNMYFDVTGYFR